ncbi:MAG: PAS domain S-box protein, partial [Proteobacteria bacterium]|nr:PAS domain S-box protein [Pseudomonadota bacterium]
GIYMDVNNKLLELQGFSSREEVLGKNAFDFVAPRDIDRARLDTQRYLEQGSIALQEYTNVRTDGSEYPVEITSTLLKDVSGKPTGFIASVRDITQRKQTEEALRESQEKLRTVFDSIGDGITVLDLTGNIIDVNETVLRIKGYNREDVIGRFGLDFIAEKDRARATEEMMVLFNGEVEQTPGTEYALIAKDGSEIPCEASASLLRDGAGNVVGLISVERDLTGHKKAERILRESEEHYRMLVETSPHGIQENDTSGLINFCNKAHHEISGYAEGELKGKYIWDLLATNHEKEELQAYFAKLVSEQPLPVPYFTRNCTKDGRIVDVQVDWNYRYDAQGQLLGFVSIITDITERIRAEQQLQESEDLLKQAEKLAGIGSWQWDLHNNTFILSDGMRLLYGTEGKGLTNFKDIVETLIHPDDREEVYKAAEGVVDEGSGKTLTYRVIRPDGEVRWMNATIPEVRSFGKDGKPEIMVGAVQDITERKQDEQQLREHEEQWKLFSESATDIFTIWDSKLYLIDNSEKGIQTFFAPGTKKEDILGKNMTELAPGIRDTGRYDAYLKVLETGKPYFTDGIVRHRKFGDMQVSIKAFKVGEGLGTIVTDITEQRQAQYQLQESEERLRAFMDSSTDIYCIFDSQLRLMDVSDKGVKAFLPDKSKEDQIGKHIAEIVPEVMETGRYEEYLKVIETGEPFQVEEVIIHPRFARRHIAIKAIKVQNGMGMIFTDITERIKAEQKSKENEERLRSFMESATDIFNIWDANLDLVYTPEKGVREYFPPGTKKEDILGRNLSEIAPDTEKTGRYDEYLKVLETGKPFLSEDVIPNKIFGDRHMFIKAFRSGNDMGQVITDITKQKQADEQIRNYSERVRAMTKQMSGLEESERRHIARELHDNVGQNLTVLGINFSMAKAQMTEAKIEEVQSILDDSQGVVEQTTEAIRDIMANLRPPVLEDYGLLAALRWYGDRFASRTGIAINVQGEEPDPRLGIDLEIVLFRIAQEALTNIAKHAKAKNVTVKYNACDGKIQLVITDDGLGFNVADISASAKNRGWGMVTMSERAQSIGGSLHVVSRPGGGTQIVVEVVR